MPLGNSITRGTGSTDNAGYRNDLAQMLNTESVNYNLVGSLSHGSGFDSDHEGHDGWTSAMILSTISTFLIDNPSDIVILHIGTNDITSLETPASIRDNIEAIIDAIKDRDPNTKLILSSLIPRNDSENSKNDELNDLLQVLFNSKRIDGYKIFYAGCNEVFKANPNWMLDWMDDTKHPNDTGYNIMAEVLLNAVMNAITYTDITVTDNFERSSLGQVWSFDPEYTIQNGDLLNTSVLDTWDYLAIYKGIVNPSMVSLKWNQSFAANVDLTGLAFNLNSSDPDNTDGYAVTIRTAFSKIRLWSIDNSVISLIGEVDQNIGDPLRGDVLKVLLSSDGTGNHFDVYVNDVYANRVTDAGFLHPSGGDLYSGILLAGNSNNHIDQFSVKAIDDLIPPSKVFLSVTGTSQTSVSLQWVAPGDDGNSGFASSYDLRYSQSIINQSNFDSATPLTIGVPIPDTAGTLQSFDVLGLISGVSYYFALKSLDDMGNQSEMSNVAGAITLTENILTDNFNRASLGSNWNAHFEYAIVSNELANTSTDNTSWHMAVYNYRKNPVVVSFKYSAGSDLIGRELGGMAVMLDSPAITASGYLIHRRIVLHEV